MNANAVVQVVDTQVVVRPEQSARRLVVPSNIWFFDQLAEAAAAEAAAEDARDDAIAEAGLAETARLAAQTAQGGAEAAQAAVVAALDGTVLANATLNAASRVLLAALDRTLGLPAFLTEAGREGEFAFDGSNLSALVAADTAQGIYIPPTGETGATGAWVRRFSGPIDARWFGATGVGDETLFPTNYSTDKAGTPHTILQQTVDGLAINAAMRVLRLKGGGTLALPKGVLTTYGYLERIDFPLAIRGAGRGVTIVRNCAASPWQHGYGVFVMDPATLTEVSISDLTIDGYGPNRSGSGPGVEVTGYNLAIYGYPKLTLHNVESRNAIIDCLYSFHETGETGAYIQATNCLFSNSFRNTASLVRGWNQQYSNCIFEKGGKVLGGTAPKAVLDIEPNSSTVSIKNITFTNCIFREATNYIIVGVWAGNVKFSNCEIEAFGGDGSTGSLNAVMPYPAFVRAGEFTFDNCRFNHQDPGYFGAVVIENKTTGDFGTTQFAHFSNCRFTGMGFHALGVRQRLTNCIFRNSFMPLFIGGAGAQDIEIDGLNLINVFDPSTKNTGGGAFASLVVTISFEGTKSYMNNVSAVVETATMPAGFATALAAVTTQGRGIFLSASATGKKRVSNVHAGGYYRQLPTALGQALDTTKFRDWGQPNGVPADTAGQNTNASAFFYRGCTQYGDAA
jgi:hypothetical protein